MSLGGSDEEVEGVQRDQTATHRDHDVLDLEVEQCNHHHRVDRVVVRVVSAVARQMEPIGFAFTLRHCGAQRSRLADNP